MTATQQDRWVVRCDDFTTRPMPLNAAERALEAIDRLGGCHNEHRIDEAPRDAE